VCEQERELLVGGRERLELGANLTK